MGAAASWSSAQVAPDLPPPPSLECQFFGSGSSDSWWKLGNPSGQSDWFNVDFDDTAEGDQVLGICVDVWSRLQSEEVMTLGIYPESTVFPHAPDLASPVAEVRATVSADDLFADLVSYSLPCLHLGSTDLHVALQPRPGDSATWLGGDSQGPAFNRSFASSTAYNTGASAQSLNWTLGMLTRPSVATKNSLLVNGQVSSSVIVESTACLAFWGTHAGQKSLLYFCSGGVPVLPLLLLQTGSPFFPGPKPETWEICIPTVCPFTQVPLTFCAIYQDYCDLKPSGKPKLKLGNTATLVVNDVLGFCQGCFGMRDDGDHDGMLWKLSNPGGPSDWFTVDLGTASTNTGAGTGSAVVTSVEIELANFCFPRYDRFLASVGVHPADVTQDPGGSTPDLSQGSAVTNVHVPQTTWDGLYPGMQFALPDLPINPGGTRSIVAARWHSYDTCIWIASDTDGTDVTNGCGSPLPNGFSASNRDDFATNATPASVANWAIKVNWNDP